LAFGESARFVLERQGGELLEHPLLQDRRGG
jgi:hypothetical protein